MSTTNKGKFESPHAPKVCDANQGVRCESYRTRSILVDDWYVLAPSGLRYNIINAMRF